MDEARRQYYIRLLKQIWPVFVVVLVSYWQTVARGHKIFADNVLFIGVIVGLIYGIYKVKKDRQLTPVELLHGRGMQLSIFLLFLIIIGFLYYNIKY